MSAISISLDALQRLYDTGVRFYIDIPTAYGVTGHLCSPGDIDLYLEDADALYALKHGITKEQFRDWRDAEHCVQCAALTKRGERCKHIALNGHMVTPSSWVELQGSYCGIHNGESGAESVRAVSVRSS